MEPLVTRIDHVVIPDEDPDDLFTLFTEGLGLPGLWPVSDVGPFRSAGVAAGNCWIEIVAGAESLTPLYRPSLPAVVRGIALDAGGTCSDAAESLHAAGVPVGPVTMFEGRRPDGVHGPLVTIAALPELVADAGIAYLCEMAAPVSAGRVADRTEAAAARSETVGIRRIAEIGIGARDIGAVSRAWSRLASPDGEGRWQLGGRPGERPGERLDGPAVHVTESPIDGITGITFAVVALDRAVARLRARGLLGALRSSGAGVNHAAAHGLDLWLVEA
ncbi:MAG TPA: hypothetical protein VM841_14490 [Actinomycetota bacterium]|nr:hypothetical protein [Actinomycetota bacterium]